MQILDGDALSELEGVVAVIVGNSVVPLSEAEDIRDGSKWKYKYLGNSCRSFTSIKKKYGC